MKGDPPVSQLHRNDRADDCVSQAMPRPLGGSEIKYCAINERDGKSVVIENVAQLLHGRVANVGNEVELPCETCKFIKKNAFLFHRGAGLEHALLDACAERRQHHPQAGQRAGVIFLLLVERQLDAHSIFGRARDHLRSD